MKIDIACGRVMFALLARGPCNYMSEYNFVYCHDIPIQCHSTYYIPSGFIILSTLSTMLRWFCINEIDDREILLKEKRNGDDWYTIQAVRVGQLDKWNSPQHAPSLRIPMHIENWN